jgi:hypothetical protein
MSKDALGDALPAFHEALQALRDGLDVDPASRDALFEGAEVWTDLLTYKLLPHMAGQGCLVVGVAGGTNTGKSTVFNLLLGAERSPVRHTAAATCRPVLAANATRAAQCLDGLLLSEFKPCKLEAPEDPLDRAADPNCVFVTEHSRLPDRFVLLDTPDVDSIDKQNWTVADHLRAAGDVVIAVLTGEKYKDDRVIQFFREAHAAGRVVIPLMNKASADNGYEVARLQLAEFCKDVGLDNPPCFVLPRNEDVARRFRSPIMALGRSLSLWDYIESLDAIAIKARVHRDTVAHFAALAGEFLQRANTFANSLNQVVTEFDRRAAATAGRYAPAPGAKVGGLFHAFVQSKRGNMDRALGAASRGMVHGVSVVGRSVRNVLLRNATLESPKAEQTETKLREHHRRELEQLGDALATEYIQYARTLSEPARHLLIEQLEHLNLEAAVRGAALQTLATDDLSETFRKHAHVQLEQWWSDHAGRRNVILALDKLLLVAPAGLAGYLALQTGGVGVPEAMIVAGPVMEQFGARMIEYQFGDQMFNFIAPWRVEQQALFRQALDAHLARPVLANLRALLDAFEGETMDTLRTSLARCGRDA